MSFASKLTGHTQSAMKPTIFTTSTLASISTSLLPTSASPLCMQTNYLLCALCACLCGHITLSYHLVISPALVWPSPTYVPPITPPLCQPLPGSVLPTTWLCAAHYPALCRPLPGSVPPTTRLCAAHYPALCSPLLNSMPHATQFYASHYVALWHTSVLAAHHPPACCLLSPACVAAPISHLWIPPVTPFPSTSNPTSYPPLHNSNIISYYIIHRISQLVSDVAGPPYNTYICSHPVAKPNYIHSVPYHQFSLETCIP